jgi:hypothetical protein
MSTKLFFTIMEGTRDHDSYFRCMPDAADNLSFTLYQKCFAVIHMFAYGVAGDLVDEYLRIKETK